MSATKYRGYWISKTTESHDGRWVVEHDEQPLTYYVFHTKQESRDWVDSEVRLQHASLVARAEMVNASIEALTGERGHIFAYTRDTVTGLTLTDLEAILQRAAEYKAVAEAYAPPDGI